MNNIIEDIKNKLDIEFDNNDINYFSDGTTDAKVFSIKNEYLIKCSTKQELDVYNEFLSRYKSSYFQKLYYINYNLGYICLSFITGEKFNNSTGINVDKLISDLYDITSNYQQIVYEGYGYLFEDHKSWYQFLEDEVNYSNECLDNEIIDLNIINKALDNIQNYKIDKYLLHGDFGTHNFIIEDDSLYVIDTMGLVGDQLYDFYFAIFSNSFIFTKVNIDDLLKYFDKDVTYKKSMMVITFFIRLCRSYKYDKENYYIYKDYYKNIISKLI